MAKKKTTKKKSEGLGDSIAKVTKATGIDKLVKFVAGEDCGCDERRKKLNKLFSYNPNIQCLHEDEYETLKDWFSKERNTVNPTEQQHLREIYNRVFNKRSTPSSCTSCVRDMVDRLRSVYKEYENDKK